MSKKLLVLKTSNGRFNTSTTSYHSRKTTPQTLM